MALTGSRVTVDTTVGGVKIFDGVETDDARGVSANVRNRGTVSVYLGASGVTTATGYQLDAGESIPVSLVGGESLYGIVASGSAVVHVLKVGA